MKYAIPVLAASFTLFAAAMAADLRAVPVPQSVPTAGSAVVNPQIDMAGYLAIAAEAAEHRKTRRLTEEEFITMSRDEDAIILDARSKAMYDLMHVKGAINLTFPDIAIDSIKKTIPDKTTRILIYCNNNFKNQPVAFAPKFAPASLNISTYISLYTYGYRNIYELAPLVDPKDSKLTFETAKAVVTPKGQIP